MVFNSIYDDDRQSYFPQLAEIAADLMLHAAYTGHAVIRSLADVTVDKELFWYQGFGMQTFPILIIARFDVSAINTEADILFLHPKSASHGKGEAIDSVHT